MADQAELVTFLTCDLAGIARGRSFPREDLDGKLRDGVGWVPANQSLSSLGGISRYDPHGSVGDLRLMPDRETAVEVRFPEGQPPLAFYLSDIVRPDGSTYSCCPRTLLRETEARLGSEAGLELNISFEHEFQLLCDDPAPPSFSLRALRHVAPFGERVVEALREAGAEPEMFIAEYGAHQYEITCRPTAAVRAADRAVVVREVVREVARTCGQRATFAPLSDPRGVANGVHIHMSLGAQVADAGSPSASEAHGLSEAEAAFAAGILRHAPALCALTAPSAISYERLRPDHWSASAFALGERNRETILRICAATDGRCHLEYRAADAAACPHLALAAIIHAGIEGIVNGLETPPVLGADPSRISAKELTEFVAAPVPADIEAAIEALRSDPAISEWLAPLLLETYLGLKRAEVEELDELELDQRCERYVQAY